MECENCQGKLSKYETEKNKLINFINTAQEQIQNASHRLAMVNGAIEALQEDVITEPTEAEQMGGA